MPRLTSKLQISIPKALADRIGLRPGDEVVWEVAGDGLRGMPSARRLPEVPPQLEQLRAFDEATARHARRPAPDDLAGTRRDWTRDDLYVR